jgi:hypothetical protein
MRRAYGILGKVQQAHDFADQLFKCLDSCFRRDAGKTSAIALQEAGRLPVRYTPVIAYRAIEPA